MSITRHLSYENTREAPSGRVERQRGGRIISVAIFLVPEELMFQNLSPGKIEIFLGHHHGGYYYLRKSIFKGVVRDSRQEAN